MKESQTIRTTFAQDTGMTFGILRLIAQMNKYSVLSFQEREDASKCYENRRRQAAGTAHVNKRDTQEVSDLVIKNKRG